MTRLIVVPHLEQPPPLQFAAPSRTDPDWKIMHHVADQSIREMSDALTRAWGLFSRSLDVDAMARSMAAGERPFLDWEEHDRLLNVAIMTVAPGVSRRSALALLSRLEGQLGSAKFTELEAFHGTHDQKTHGRRGGAGAQPGDVPGYIAGKTLPAGYMYHGTPKRNLPSIKREGLKTGRNGVLFLGKHDEAGWVGGSSAIVRVRNSHVPTVPVKRGGGWVISKPIPPQHLEYWAADQKWHSISDLQEFTETFATRADPWYQLEFELRYMTAEKFIQGYLPKLIIGISAETQRAVQGIVLEGFRTGRHPYEMADEIMKVVGLLPGQVRAYQEFAKNLQKGFLPSESQQRRLIAYRNMLLRRRADNIARTETIRAANAGQLTLWDEATANGLLAPGVMRKWIATPGERTCPYCSDLWGDKTTLNMPWDTPFGPIDQPPLHPSCRCAMGLTWD